MLYVGIIYPVLAPEDFIVFLKKTYSFMFFI